eukprot:PhM_4_TR1505/c0_g1_i1/m.45899
MSSSISPQHPMLLPISLSLSSTTTTRLPPAPFQSVETVRIEHKDLLLPGDERPQSYRVINEFAHISPRPLGWGATGDVRLVMDVNTYQQYALKRVRRDAGRHERDIFKHINGHPNIIRLYKFLDDGLDQDVYLVLEYMTGGTVTSAMPNTTTTNLFSFHTPPSRPRRNSTSAVTAPQLIDSPSPAPSSSSCSASSCNLNPSTVNHNNNNNNNNNSNVNSPSSVTTTTTTTPTATTWAEEDLLEFTRQIAPALRHMHERGVAHGDIKPENVFCSEDRRTFKLGDFGCASRVRDSDAVTRLMGTPAFFPPEATSESIWAYSMDMWAFGITLYSLLFGSLPFQGEGVLSYHSDVVARKVEVPTMYPRSRVLLNDKLHEVLTRLLAQSPEERMTVSELCDHTWLTGSSCAVAENSRLGALARQKAQTPSKRVTGGSFASAHTPTSNQGTPCGSVTRDGSVESSSFPSAGLSAAAATALARSLCQVCGGSNSGNSSCSGCFPNISFGAGTPSNIGSSTSFCGSPTTRRPSIVLPSSILEDALGPPAHTAPSTGSVCDSVTSTTLEPNPPFRILIVDDNGATRETTLATIQTVVDSRRVLVEATMTTTSFYSSSYDVIFMDIHTLNRNGFDTADEVRDAEERAMTLDPTRRRAYIVGTSRQDNPEEVRNLCKLSRMNEFMLKPVTESKVRAIFLALGLPVSSPPATRTTNNISPDIRESSMRSTAMILDGDVVVASSSSPYPTLGGERGSFTSQSACSSMTGSLAVELQTHGAMAILNNNNRATSDLTPGAGGIGERSTSCSSGFMHGSPNMSLTSMDAGCLDSRQSNDSVATTGIMKMLAQAERRWKKQKSSIAAALVVGAAALSMAVPPPPSSGPSTLPSMSSMDHVVLSSTPSTGQASTLTPPDMTVVPMLMPVDTRSRGNSGATTSPPSRGGRSTATLRPATDEDDDILSQLDGETERTRRDLGDYLDRQRRREEERAKTFLSRIEKREREEAMGRAVATSATPKTATKKTTGELTRTDSLESSTSVQQQDSYGSLGQGHGSCASDFFDHNNSSPPQNALFNLSGSSCTSTPTEMNWSTCVLTPPQTFLLSPPSAPPRICSDHSVVSVSIEHQKNYLRMQQARRKGQACASFPQEPFAAAIAATFVLALSESSSARLTYDDVIKVRDHARDLHHSNRGATMTISEIQNAVRPLAIQLQEQLQDPNHGGGEHANARHHPMIDFLFRSEIGQRPSQEDRLCVIPYFSLVHAKTNNINININSSNNEDHHHHQQVGESVNNDMFIGVFDGHAGDEVATYAAHHLHQHFSDHPEFATDPAKALAAAFTTCNEAILAHARATECRAGATATVVYYRDHTVYVANAGDCRVVLWPPAKRGGDIGITRIHDTRDLAEVQAVLQRGGEVLSHCGRRVNGRLLVTRALGDLPDASAITCVPDVHVIPRERLSATSSSSSASFLVVATDGLWNLVDEEVLCSNLAELRDALRAEDDSLSLTPELLAALLFDAKEKIQEHTNNNNTSTPSSSPRRRRGSMHSLSSNHIDNITVGVLFFQGEGEEEE